MTTFVWKRLGFGVPALMVMLGCASAPPRPKAPPYEPRFGYSVPSAGQKVDVTVGLVAPQFSGDGATYWQASKNDEVAGAMFRGLRTSFNELLVAKGFNVSGPFDSVDNMTFPEKKGADFVLYPEIDVRGAVELSEIQQVQSGNSLTGYQFDYRCDAKIKMNGAVLIIAKEPLSGEKMWVKKVEVTIPDSQLTTEGDYCKPGSGAKPAEDVRTAWGKVHESMYSAVMSNLDKYVSGEEFQMLKTQAGELRAKKSY